VANQVVASNPWTAFTRGAVLPPTPNTLKAFLLLEKE
jgi:hypothetical protein